MRKPRILLVLHVPPPVHGSSIVGKFIKDSKIINNSFNCRIINLGTSYSVDEIGKNPIAKIKRYFLIIGKVVFQLIVFRPHLFYLAITAKGIGFYKDSLFAFIAKLFGRKIVYHFHNKGVKSYQEKKIDNFLYRKVFKNAKVILLSKHLYPDIQKYVPLSQIYFCPNGIPEIYYPRDNKPANKPQVSILFLSNLYDFKGIFILLQACKILKEKSIPFECTVVGGEGKTTAQQFRKKINEMELNELVNYVGKKYNSEKEEIFQQADILIHPTYNDCFPLVLLEAMQHNLPIISTYEGGIPEIIDDGINGYLIPQKDAEALASKLELLIMNPNLRKNMGIAGSEKFKKEFTLTTFEVRLKDILTEIVN